MGCSPHSDIRKRQMPSRSSITIGPLHRDAAGWKVNRDPFLHAIPKLTDCHWITLTPILDRLMIPFRRKIKIFQVCSTVLLHLSDRTFRHQRPAVRGADQELRSPTGCQPD